MFSFDPPENIRKPKVFRGIKREHWEEKCLMFTEQLVYSNVKNCLHLAEFTRE